MARQLVAIFIASFLILPTAHAQLSASSGNAIPGQYFVRLEDGQARWGDQSSSPLPSVSAVAADLTAQYGGQASAVFDGCIQGFVFHGNARDAARLARDSRVRRTAQDTVVIPEEKGCILACPSHPNHDPNWEPELKPFGSVNSPQPITCPDPEPSSETCEDGWGLDRIDDRPTLRDGSYSFDNEGQGVHVYVVDTGIFAEHPDFRFEGSPVPRVREGRNVYADVMGSGDPTDVSDEMCSRHGSSVASVIAGREFGVAKQAFIHPVKFTNSNGGSTVGTWIAALDWVANNRVSPAVINISSNGQLTESPIFDDLASCTQAILDMGIPIVESAGNQNDVEGDACEWTLADPVQGVPGVLVAGGMDQFDSRWERDVADPDFVLCQLITPGDCGSNTGSCVDLWAPAAHIVMAHGYPAGVSGQQAVCHSSGTSFAAPHITGVIALYLRDHPGATVAEVTDFLRASAWAGVLDSSILDPNPGDPESNNLLVNSTLNLRPIAVDDFTSTVVGTQVTIAWSTLFANDSDPEAGPLDVCGVGTPTHGTIVSSGNGSTTYAPPPGCFIGKDFFDYTLCDDGGGQDIATVTVDIGGIICPPPTS